MRKITILATILVVAGCFNQMIPGQCSQGSSVQRRGFVTMRGMSVTLLGPELRVGEKAPNFEVVDQAFKPIHLSSFRGKIVLVSAVPSLDTQVCSLQTKRFNEEAGRLSKDVVVLTISMDLPFAQKRFCKAEQVDKIQILSDCVSRDFGQKYGVLIKERGFLSRSIFVISKDGRLLYKELVRELSHQPNYEAALKAVRKAAK